MGHRDLFKALDQFRKKWIGNVFNNDPEKPAAARNQGARVRVGKVVSCSIACQTRLESRSLTAGEPLTCGRR